DHGPRADARARRRARDEPVAGAAGARARSAGRSGPARVSAGRRFDPYELFDALQRERISYVVVGAFARVVHGSAERTSGVDIVPSLRDENLRRLGNVLEALDGNSTDGGPVRMDTLNADEPLHVQTRAGEVRVIATPWGTRGYDDIRIRANRE